MATRSSMALGLALLVMAAATHAQGVYKIIGADGKVTFSDKPPTTAQSATSTATPLAPGGSTAGADLPFELRQVVSKYPFTLYSSTQCGPCDTARTMLKSRGVPFSEKTVTTAEDSEALQRLSGESSLPYATIGAQKLKGFSDTVWTQYLDAAGYPKTSILPKSYRYPAAAPLVAVQKAPSPKTSPVAKPAEAPPPPTPTTPSPSNPAGSTF
nr:glutaredoxin family protein [uncultured Rhodoferax sp.]